MKNKSFLKRGCLIILVVPIILILLVIGYAVIFPKKPASEEIKKSVLLNEYNQIKNSDRLNKKIEVFEFLENNKHVILDSLITPNDNSYALLDLWHYNENRPHLPKKIFDELSTINSKDNYRDSYKLKITKKGKLSLIYTITDYKNYLYIVHSLNRIDTLSLDNKLINYSKTIIIKDSFQYKLTIKDAFNDIDPNNLSPN
ncbi:hypothetical protein [Aquimarina sp. 2201CG14-23]|uniref:hypothetical protein n=1 Tax=Aquimarina mycalae TaxID=3040073 RepID=UPI002478134A|nr:hypothetical protein [Aquimarina sp. 2201CG14-23]MDH7447810.1 hypothetical protein [Aquimarina sp. 2201CG14-23]